MVLSGNEKVLINFKDANIPGVPDGMAIDVEDKLWITAFRGHQVNIFRSTNANT